ncbi:hypothetical protein WMY93_031732, partial [Mugilogobius chulae]
MRLFGAPLVLIGGGSKNMKVENYESVVCALQRSCVLPCSFIRGNDPLIHWTKKPHDQTSVHVYYYGQDQLHHQHQNYTNRTSLFEKQLSTGNASLLLSELQSRRWSLQKKNEQLVCFSENISPKPSVSWTPPSAALTTFNPSADGLWSVLSSVSLSDKHEYICNVSTTHSWRSATYRRNEGIYRDLSHYVELLCTEPKAPVKSLIWRFNKKTILNRSGQEPVVYTESWRQFVDGVTQSNSLVLKRLNIDHQGLFSCEISTDTEEFFIHTEVTNAAGFVFISVIIIVITIILRLCG